MKSCRISVDEIEFLIKVFPHFEKKNPDNRVRSNDDCSVPPIITNKRMKIGSSMKHRNHTLRYLRKKNFRFFSKSTTPSSLFDKSLNDTYPRPIDLSEISSGTETSCTLPSIKLLSVCFAAALR